MICSLFCHTHTRLRDIPEFVKKGRTSATIEVMLTNEGDMAYKPDIYGDTITILRIIGNVSSYKIKSSKGI